MRSRLLAGVALVVWIVSAGTAQAVEPYLDFVQGLRKEGYYDYAILYLDQIAAKPNTPAEVKQVISYQKAMTLKDSTKAIRSPEKQLEVLTQAEAFLEEFVKANPNHPNAAEANSERASILLNKGQAENLQAKSPSNQGNKREFQARARDYVSKAREVFQAAFDQHEANFKKFPVFIDQANDPKQYAARANVEQNLITTSLNLGMCTYEEAQTHDADSNEFKQLLNKAAEEFEKMHQKYRSQVGGLYARAWQGKCYEEQKDLQKAMGIYKELLDHPGENPALSQLKSQTLYFLLLCLNSKERHDHQLVIGHVDDWVKKHPGEVRTRLGLSIQWEQAKAYEILGDDTTLLKTEQERFWKLARAVALQIQKFPGEYADVSSAMLQRLQIKLGGRTKDADTFQLANGLAHNSFTAAMELEKEIVGLQKSKPPAPPEEIAKRILDRKNELNEAAHNFELALSLYKPTDDKDKKAISVARLHYAYVNYWQQKTYEAAVLADFVARTADKDDGSVALDGAYMAMAAFVKEYNDNKAPVDQKGDDMKLIIKSANLIAERWPSSDKANEAFMILGRMIGAQKKPAEAAGWFGKVPESDPKYPDAQLAAGQAYWTAYLTAGRSLEKPTPEQLTGWLKSAQDHLGIGIAKLSATAAQGAAPPELIAAKMSLSQILISQGKDAEALKLLNDDPHSVIKAVTVADESARKEAGVTSRRFATESYKLVLRAYIGTGNLDKARETMTTLETIVAAGGVEGGSEVTELYVSLGKLLRDELERFQANGETERYDKLMTSFETFLNDMASRKDQAFGSLSWIGETYFALGETVSQKDPAKGTAFYEKAGNAFNDILTRAKADQNFASSKQTYGVKLRQVHVLRLKKEFAQAETLVTEILTENPNSLNVQTEAAELFQDWGISGHAESAKKLILAIQGTSKTGGNVWGWGQIAFKLQKSSEFATNPVYQENFLNARYNGSFCRLKYAREQTAKDKQKQLEGCRTEIMATTAVTKDMPDEQYQKFNALYRDVFVEMGKAPEDLPKATDVPIAAAPEPATVDANTEKGPGEKPKEPVKPEPPKGISTTTWAIFGACLVFGVGAVGWVLTKGKTKGKSFDTAATAGTVSFKGVSIGEVPPATFVAPKPRPRPPAASGGATANAPAGSRPAAKPAATKPAAAKPAVPGAAGTAAPKPKPKPPSPPTSK